MEDWGKPLASGWLRTLQGLFYAAKSKLEALARVAAWHRFGGEHLKCMRISADISHVGCLSQDPNPGMVPVQPGLQARHGLCKLPVFRPVALKMMKLLGNEEAEVQTLATLLRSDPALSAQVLAVANSSIYGNGHSIDNLGGAVLVLGF